MSARRLGAALAALGLAAGAVLTGPLTGAAFAVDNECEGVEATTTGGDASGDSLPFDALGIRRAQNLVERYAPKDRRPVGVAVLDSGVYGAVGDQDPIPILARYDATEHPTAVAPDYYHGTAVAGLIAGRDRSETAPVGIAPHAQIIDVRVYDTDDEEAADDEGADPVSAEALATGLEWVATHAKQYNIKVANVSLALHEVDAVEAAVRHVRAAHVIVVASSGNRPAEGAEFYGEFTKAEDIDPGSDVPLVEDAADKIFPAGYDDVIAVNSTDGGAEGTSLIQAVLKNSQTDVAVPTAGAISYGLNGDACRISAVGTSWAAAEVSGILALLCQRFPDDTAQQVMARLVATASGMADDRTPMTGAGVAQPAEALTRPLAPKQNGDVEQIVTQESGDETTATAPEPDPDPLAGIRDDAVWWGLIGGGALVVALLLRPVLARRRT